ncbi:MAG: uroporphyrinogen decarboxylase family protein [Burkholderiales bacterium]
MTKSERVRSALRGEAPDRPPYGFWTHLPGIDLDPERLAQATAAFCARYDLDFVKSMPNGLYCVEDWGAVCDYSEIERGGVAKVVVPAVKTAGDWTRLRRADVFSGSFGRELAHLRRLKERVGPDVPVLATVFSPLTIAAKLGNGIHRDHLAHEPEALRRGLETITDVTCAFARAAIESGCAGVFFAVQEAQRETLDESAYRTFGEPYDRRVLAAAKAAGGWFNVLHMHGDGVMFELLRTYDVAALNWHIGETPPSIAEYRDSGGRSPILGGLQRGHITRRDADSVRRDIERTMTETAGRGILIAPACVIRHPVDEKTLLGAAAAIKGYATPRR